MATNDKAPSSKPPRAARPARPPLSAALTDRPAFLAETMKLPDLAKRYGVSLPTVYKWIEGAEGFHPPLPSMKLGREHLVHLPTADAWVKARLTSTPVVA